MNQFRSLTLAIGLTGVVLSSSYVEAKPRPGSQGGSVVPIPEYGDKSPWAVYVRRLQDTVAKRWYDEIFYYNYPSSISRGVVTLRYTFDPSGKVVSQTVVSNTANQPFADRALAAVQNARIQAIPASILSTAPRGFTVEQTFRFRDNDPTEYGLASSYPQLLHNRFPDTGAAENLDLRRFYPLQRFIYQSRIVSIAGT
ncbi:MAG TPA: energy transducer TonB [Chthoniobacterales bacterium]|nr:energy transducer TonB [Chthoniobacterales bacterium]